MKRNMFAREHILAAFVALAILAAAALWVRRRPEPAGRTPPSGRQPVAATAAERLIVRNFGPVELATPEARERIRRELERQMRGGGR